jgi:hypothetical protein
MMRDGCKERLCWVTGRWLPLHGVVIGLDEKCVDLVTGN